MRRTLAVAALLAALLGILVVVPSAAHAAVRLTKTEQAILDAVNRERAARGLPNVRANAALMRAARNHTRSMAHHSYFSHIDRAGRSIADRVRDLGYGSAGFRVWVVGETLARATPGAPVADVKRIVSGWMRSPRHRRVILTRALCDAGAGIHVGGGWQYFALDLGRRRR